MDSLDLRLDGAAEPRTGMTLHIICTEAPMFRLFVGLIGFIGFRGLGV